MDHLRRFILMVYVERRNHAIISLLFVVDRLGCVLRLARQLAAQQALQTPADGHQSTGGRIVDRMVDNPEHLARIKTLEGELAVLPGLRSQLAKLEATVDNPEHLIRIKFLEDEIARIPALRNEIVELRSAPPKIVEVEKIIEKPVDRVVEKVVDRVVEKIVEKTVDNPQHMVRIRALESEVSAIAGLRSQIVSLQSAPPRVVANPETWPEQADLAARNRWRALKSLQDGLIAGNR